MIVVTKLDGGKILINLENIKYVEAVPDTILTYLTGETLIIKESIDALRSLAVTFKGDVLRYAQKDKE